MRLKIAVSVVRFRPWAPSCFALTRFAGLQPRSSRSRMPSEASGPPKSAFGRRRLAEEGCPNGYVYLLQSEASAGQRYVGITSDLRQRLADHNAGRSPHTSKYAPWRLVTYVAFSDGQKAETF